MSKITRFPDFLDVETKVVALDEIFTTVRFSSGLVFIEQLDFLKFRKFVINFQNPRWLTYLVKLNRPSKQDTLQST